MTLPLQRVNKTSVTDVVMEQLLDLFLEGSMKFGDRLPTEAELARQLGIGRNSIREAVKVLEVLGIVERRQGDGTYVTADGSANFAPLLLGLLTHMASAAELVELRQLLEVGLVDLVIDKITDEGIAKLADAIAELERLVDAGAPAEELVAADMKFHYIMLESVGNRSIMKLGKMIVRLCSASMVRHLADPDGGRRAVNDHKAILEAIRNQDRVGARERVIESFKVWKTYVKVPRDR